MEMKQNVSESETVLSSKQKKYIFQIPRPKEQNIFQIPRPKEKKYFQIPATQTRHFHDQILAVVFSWSIVSSAGRLFCQQKVGHGNETKCFGIRNSSFIQTKKIFFRFFDPNKKKKIFFRFLD